MKRLLLAPILLLALAASAQAKIPHRYWWMGVSNCTISDSTYRYGGAWKAQPYIICTETGAHWAVTSQTINPADNVGTVYGPCGYEGDLCKP